MEARGEARGFIVKIMEERSGERRQWKFGGFCPQKFFLNVTLKPVDFDSYQELSTGRSLDVSESYAIISHRFCAHLTGGAGGKLVDSNPQTSSGLTSGFAYKFGTG